MPDMTLTPTSLAAAVAPRAGKIVAPRAGKIIKNGLVRGVKYIYTSKIILIFFVIF